MNIYYAMDEKVAYLENGVAVVPSTPSNKNTVNPPVFLYGNSYQINWQNVKTKGDGTPDTWLKDNTYYSTPVLATLVFDNNHLHCYRSSLDSVVEIEEVEEGEEVATYTIDVSIQNLSFSDVLKVGNLLLFDSNGDIEKIRYINREKTSKGFKFYVTSAPLYNYNEGDLVGIPESFFAHGTFNLDNSDIQNGLFSFDMTFVGDKLNSEMLFGGKPYIDISYMAMRILSDDGAVEEAECITAARIENTVSGLRGLRFNENNYIANDPVLFIIQEQGLKVNPRGIYDESITYAKNDGVSFEGSYYRSISDNNAGNQPTDSAKWEIMIEKGADGEPFEYDDFTPEQLALLEGPEGPQGDKGDMLTTATMAVTYVDDVTGVTMARLDDVYDSITLFDTAVNCQSLLITLKSANPLITGDIALVPVINAVAQAEAIVAVGADWTTIELPLTATVASIRLVRDTGSANDTLKDGATIVTAQVAGISYKGA